MMPEIGVNHRIVEDNTCVRRAKVNCSWVILFVVALRQFYLVNWNPEYRDTY